MFSLYKSTLHTALSPVSIYWTLFSNILIKRLEKIFNIRFCISSTTMWLLFFKYFYGCCSVEPSMIPFAVKSFQHNIRHSSNCHQYTVQSLPLVKRIFTTTTFFLVPLLSRIVFLRTVFL